MARQKYFGKWCVYHAGSEAYAMELMARDNGLRVVPKSQNIEVTEESDFDGSDFARFSMNDDGCDYTEIISTLRYEDEEWVFTAQDIDMSLSDEDLQYLNEYYAEEMYKVLNGEPKNIRDKVQQI